MAMNNALGEINKQTILFGPTRGELEKYPSLKSAWEEWQVIYKLTVGNKK